MTRKRAFLDAAWSPRDPPRTLVATSVLLAARRSSGQRKRQFRHGRSRDCYRLIQVACCRSFRMTRARSRPPLSDLSRLGGPARLNRQGPRLAAGTPRRARDSRLPNDPPPRVPEIHATVKQPIAAHRGRMDHHGFRHRSAPRPPARRAGGSAVAAALSLGQTAAVSDAPRAVIFDLDGVIRDWNDEAMYDLEAAFGLPPGIILSIGFGSDLGPAATTGRITFREWMDEIRRRVVALHGEPVIGALDEWEANIGTVDTEMLAVLRSVRRHCTAAVLSNGTTRLRRDLHALDLVDEFDVIYNTAELGVAKPDPAVFERVLADLELSSAEAVFIDDLAVNVEGARSVGLRAHVHTDRDSTVAFLVECGVPLSDQRRRPTPPL